MSKPSEGELEILRILWHASPATVRQVNERLNEQRPVGYTTTLKQMQIMHEKGLLSREKEGKTHLYRPLISENETRSRLIDKLLDSAFGGSTAELVMQALGHHRTSREELDEIRQLLDQLEEDQNNDDSASDPQNSPA